MARADRRRAAREGGQHRAPTKHGRRLASRVLRDESAYLAGSKRARAAHNRVLDVADAWDENSGRSLSALSRRYGTTVETVKRHVPTEHAGRRLELVPPGERKLYRGSIPMLADVDGRPQVVHVVPANDAQWRAIQGHDAAVFAAVTKEEDGDLARYRSRVVVDTETGHRFRFYTDGEGIREATETGEVELSELHYSGGRRHDLDVLLAGTEEG